MLVNPKVKLFMDGDMVVAQVEDEGTAVKVDITKEVLALLNKKA